MYDFQVVPHTNPAVGFMIDQFVLVQPDSLLTVVVFVDPLGAAQRTLQHPGVCPSR